MAEKQYQHSDSIEYVHEGGAATFDSPAFVLERVEAGLPAFRRRVIRFETEWEPVTAEQLCADIEADPFLSTQPNPEP